MLDDAAFAAAWVGSRDRARPRSARALRAELRLKGVPADDVEAALAAREARASSDEPGPDGPPPAPAPGERASSLAADLEAAARLLDRRGPSLLREADPRRRRAKAYALLARNGFDADTCGSAVAAWSSADGGARGDADEAEPPEV
jgi:SOS response regulatory protein OraA/RecX